jgi:regulator of sirC expression with transglutaminase-like and TPR domain
MSVFIQMQSSFQPSEAQIALQALCASDIIPLDEVLHWIAKDEDPNATNDSLECLDALAAGIHLPNPSDTLDVICRINQHLFHKHRFSGDTEDYYHPQNSLINKVLERKRGLPIVLGVIYIEVARRLGIEIQGIGFPRHFLIQPVNTERLFFIDPFDAGNILVEEDLLSWHEIWGIDQPFEMCILPSSTKSIILRMCHNLFYAHKRLGHFEGMLRSLERLMVLQPQLTELYRTRSVILGRLKRYQESIEALELYMLYNPESEDILECQHTLMLLKQLAKEA